MRWNKTTNAETTTILQLEQALGIPTAVATILAQRGITSFEAAKTFFRPDLKALHDPFLMLGMSKAVDRILQAVSTGEKILVYGDYDVDGTTAVALLFSCLKTLTSEVATYIPDRYSEGYGLSSQGVQFASDNDIGLLITLDCGIKAVERVAEAKALGIDSIICDHHLPGEQLPSAVAILDPKQKDCLYPYKELCGCGIGFKLIQALTLQQEHDFEVLYPYLDLVATAIAADIVPLTGENRILAYYGLKQLNKAPRPGFELLIQNTKKKVLQLSDLVFVIAPRINAAGRMQHGQRAVDLLCSETTEIALPYARSIELMNGERRLTDEKITEEALAQIQDLKTEFSTVVMQEHWHKGVVGIVASRLIESFYRPTAVLTASGDQLVGSVRSVKGFDVYEALVACSDHFIQFGGHKYAAGLTMTKEALEPFRAAFEQAVKERILPEQREPSMLYDATLTLNEITPKLFRIFQQMAPFGPQNMRPVFRTQGLKDAGGSKVVGKEQTHLKLEVTDFSGAPVSGIAFGMAEHIHKIKSQVSFELLYTLDENEFNGVKTLQLKVKALRFTE
jgi:single-stranded-DNA-specific exonuclease